MAGRRAGPKERGCLAGRREVDDVSWQPIAKRLACACQSGLAIGSDFYGAVGDELIQGIEDVSRFPYLIAELVRRGWSDDNLVKLSRSNLLRAFAEAEGVADELQQARPPSLKTIEELDAVHSQ